MWCIRGRLVRKRQAYSCDLFLSFIRSHSLVSVFFRSHDDLHESCRTLCLFRSTNTLGYGNAPQKKAYIETAAVVSLSSSLCSSAREDQKHTPTTDSYETDGRKKKLADMQSSIAILYVQDRMAKAWRSMLFDGCRQEPSRGDAQQHVPTVPRARFKFSPERERGADRACIYIYIVNLSPPLYTIKWMCRGN